MTSCHNLGNFSMSISILLWLQKHGSNRVWIRRINRIVNIFLNYRTAHILQAASLFTRTDPYFSNCTFHFTNCSQHISTVKNKKWFMDWNWLLPWRKPLFIVGKTRSNSYVIRREEHIVTRISRDDGDKSYGTQTIWLCH